MDKYTTFTINGTERSFSVANSPEFRTGSDEVLSTLQSDITFELPWYAKGYTEQDFLGEEEFALLKAGLSQSVKSIINQSCGIATDDFSLEKYHYYVKTDADHFKVVSKTRDLFSDDFSFSVEKLMPRLSKVLGFNLTDVNAETGDKMHIIVRINRPRSNDYNPPHKDIYEAVDDKSAIPAFVNFWIPIAGVTEQSNLPLSPGSHLLSEDKVLRTFEGGMIQGNKYRVRMIKSWGGDNTLQRSKVKYGQVLIFSSHLIHGLAVNDESDTTRVSLEFRLFKV